MPAPPPPRPQSAPSARPPTSSCDVSRGRPGVMQMESRPDSLQSAENGQGLSCLQLRQLVEVVMSLLEVHEVRLAIELLEHLCDSNLGNSKLPFGQKQLELSVAAFLEQAKREPCGEGFRALSASIRVITDDRFLTQAACSRPNDPKVGYSAGTTASLVEPMAPTCQNPAEMNVQPPTAAPAEMNVQPPTAAPAEMSVPPLKASQVAEMSVPSPETSPRALNSLSRLDEIQDPIVKHDTGVLARSCAKKDTSTGGGGGGGLSPPSQSRTQGTTASTGSSAATASDRSLGGGGSKNTSSYSSKLINMLNPKSALKSSGESGTASGTNSSKQSRTANFGPSKSSDRLSKSFGMARSWLSGPSRSVSRIRDKTKVSTVGIEEEDSDSEDEVASQQVTQVTQGTKDTKVICEENAHRLGKPTHGFIIHPNHLGRTIWDFVSFLWIVVESMTIPFSISFDADTPDVWYLSSTIFFTIDILLTFLTGFFVDGVLIMRQSLIVRRYVKGFFIVDLISAIPWEHLPLERLTPTTSGAIRLSKMLRLVRLMRLSKLRDLLSRLEDIMPHSSLAFSFLNTLSFLVLLCHWAACCWGFLGSPAKLGLQSSYNQPHDLSQCEPAGPCEPGIFGSPWMHRYGIEHFDVKDKYLASLHFATGLMTGNDVGMDASHWYERVFVILAMIISFLVCSTVLSKIVSMNQKWTEDSAEHHERILQMKRFMMNKKVPMTVQSKVARYLDFQHKLQRSGLSDQQAVFEQLSPWLRYELTEHLNGSIISRHPFFQELPGKVFKRICAVCNNVLCAPGDVVFQRGRRADYICFIMRGKLHVQQAGSKSQDEIGEVIVLSSPAFLGDACLFTEMLRGNTVTAITHAELLTLNKDDFKSVLLDFPKVQPLFEEWSRKYKEESKAGLRCEHCGQMGHSSVNCSLLKDTLREVGLVQSASGDATPKPGGFVRARSQSRANPHGFGRARSNTKTAMLG